MESIVAAWNDMVRFSSNENWNDCENEIFKGILNEVWKHKLIFVETPDANETSIALENYRRVLVLHYAVVFSTDSGHSTGL